MNDSVYKGRALTAGVGIGPASILPDFNYDLEEVEIHPEAVENELERFRQALVRTKSSTQKLIDHVNDTMFEDLGELFVVQESLLEDPSFRGRVVRQIKENHLCAESAVMKAMKSLEEDMVERASSPDQSPRVVDFLDAGMRILGHLEAPVSRPRLPHGGVLVARRLAPSLAVYLEDYEIKGLVVGNTNRSSHIAVVAQSLEIPTVGLEIETFYEEVEVGMQTIVSANENRVYLEPSENTMETHRQIRDNFEEFTTSIRKQAEEVEERELPLDIRGNLGLMEEISLLEDYGGSGAGLVRTEFLFLDHNNEIPDETVQAEFYHRLAEFIHPDPINLRTFDFGGDKQTFPEPESVQGRGIYRELFNKRVLEEQLRAMCRAYQEFDNLSILLPLVGSVAEVREVRSILDDLADDRGWKLPPLGIMVEVPSVFFALEEILPMIDYLSFGTNDLLNYLLGSDRFGSFGADSVHFPDPALFEFISRVIEKINGSGVTSGLCGEIAANPIFTPVWMGLGLDELSMAPMRIPEVKVVAGACGQNRARQLAQEVRTIKTRDEMKDWVNEELVPLVSEILADREIPEAIREFDYRCSREAEVS